MFGFVDGNLWNWINKLLRKLKLKQPIFNGLTDTSLYTFTYDAATRQATVTNSGCDVVVSGTRVTPVAETTTAHDDTTDTYFFYYESGNTTLTVSTTPWSILAGAPVGFVYYNTDQGAAKGLHVYELHTTKWQALHHYTEHFFHGTKYISGQALADYTLQPVVPADSDNQFSVAAGVIADEDIDWTVTALAAGGPYYIFYRAGADAANRWDWDTAATVPFKYTALGYINYNQNNAGTWQQTELATNNYVNMWVFSFPNGGGTVDIGIVQGQEVYTTLAAASAEAWSDIDWGDNIPFTEIVPLYQVIFRTSAAYGSTGQCRVARVVDLRGIIKGGTAVVGTPTDHQTLSNRDAIGAHPVTAISGTAENNIISVDSSLNLQELTVAEQRIVGRKTAGSTAALTDDEVHSIIFGASNPINQGIQIGNTYDILPAVAFGSDLGSSTYPFYVVNSGQFFGWAQSGPAYFRGYVYSTDDGDTTEIGGVKAGGTISSPQAVGNGELLCNLSFRGYLDASTVAIGAQIFGITTQAWSAGNNGTELQVWTCPNASGTEREVATFRQDGVFESLFGIEVAAAKSVDCYTNAAYLKPRRVSQSAQPTPDTGEILMWRDTDDDKTYLVYNDPGVGARKVELT